MKRLMIIGAGFLQDFVIVRANAMGYETVTVDMDPDAVGFSHAGEHAVINITDQEACLAYAREKHINGVLTAATDYGVLTASYIARELGLPGLHYATAQRIKNKYEVRKCLEENHVDDTGFSFALCSEGDVAACARAMAFPLMVKPCDGSGSRGASRVDSRDELLAAYRYACANSMTHRAVAEPFVEGREYGVESLVIQGEIHVLGIMKKWMTDAPFYAELGHAMPSGLDECMEEKIKACVTSALRALEVNHGSVNMDILVTEQGSVHIVDVGARMGGNMIGPCIIPMGTGIDYMGNMIRAAVGDAPDWSVGPREAVASRLLAFHKGVVQPLPEMREVEDRFRVRIYHHMEEGQQVQEYRTNLDGCGYVIAGAENVFAAEQQVVAAKMYLEQYIQ